MDQDDSKEPPKQPQLNELLQQQNLEMEAMYRSINYIQSLAEANRIGPILENRSKHLYMSWEICRTRHYHIHQVASAEDRKTRSYFTKHCYEKLEEKYLEVSDLISVWMTAANPQQSTDFQSTTPGRFPEDSNVKLPPLSIPTFSGKLTDWATFKDTFEALITSRSSLSDLEKLYYLKNSVRGDADELLCNVPLVATNFSIAWNLLKTRYANTQASVNAHLNEIFSIEPIKKESASSLLNLRNIIKRNLAALKNLNRPIEQYSDVLINRLVGRIDPSTQRDWELNLASNTDCPTYNEFDNFLLARIRALEALNRTEPTVKSYQNQTKSVNAQPKSTPRNNKPIVANSYVVSDQNNQCAICNQAHKIYKCPTFKNMSAIERYNKVKALHLCINCLATGHKIQDCSSSYTCHECQLKHHTMLHRNNSSQDKDSSSKREDKGSPSTSAQAESNNIQSHFSTARNLKQNRVLLATVQVGIILNKNKKVQVRALLDQGSTWSFVSIKLANALNAKRTQVTATLTGLSGSSAGTSSSIIELNLCPIHSETPIFHTQALVIPRITTYVPAKRIPFERWPHLSNIEFSDNLTSTEEIHLLIGADLYGGLILDEIRKGKISEPVAQKTVFGWVLSGPLSSDGSLDPATISVHHCTPVDQLNSAITKFWEVQDICLKKTMSPDDEFCEMHFATTHTRTSDGHSRHIAEKSLKRLEARLEKNLEHKSMYVQFMSEYELLQHMIPFSISDLSSEPIVYLPYHPIFRESSQTTKLRVVFNASSKTSNGTSINDHMLTGPKLQCDLSTILTQWRSYPIIFTADIAKMYRQLLIDPRDRNYQHILWRPSSNQPIIDYQLATVTYGTRSAPYLALRVIKQLIIDEGSKFPLASIVLSQDTFVDDLLFGDFDEDTAMQVRNEVIALLQKAHLTPRKWASNHPSLIADVDPSNHGLAWNYSSLHEKGIKVLGIVLDPDSDSFHFKADIEVPKILTYRQALSLLSQLFDPVGWISPVIVVGKILMQKTWLSNAEWDKPLPTQLENEWSNYFLSLKDLSNISIPRWNHFHPENTHTELHGFADASERAYGAVVYLRTVSKSGASQVSLIASKTKVAPIKKLTIPRLELQAALLLAKMLDSLIKVRAFSQVPIQCWTDSTVVLAWLSKHASTWKLFVSNRVSEIQTLLPTQQWRHVPSQSNPADLASRGQSPSSLQHATLW